QGESTTFPQYLCLRCSRQRLVRVLHVPRKTMEEEHETWNAWKQGCKGKLGELEWWGNVWPRVRTCTTIMSVWREVVCGGECEWEEKKAICVGQSDME